MTTRNLSVLLLIFLLIVFLLPGGYAGAQQKKPAKPSVADTERSVYDKAQKENTVNAYEEFLERFPQSKFAVEARARIEALKKERHPAFRDAKRARIIISESYEEANKVTLASRIIEITSKILKYAGVEVTTKPKETDFTIKVDIKGKALTARYLYAPYPSYTGAEIKSTVVFESKDGYMIKEEGVNRENPPYQISWIGEFPYRTPDNAPFGSALHMILYKQMHLLVYKSFGIKPLICALRKGDLYAKDVLIEIGKPAVEPLIEILNDENPDVRSKVVYILGKIKDPRAVEPLIEALKDKDSGVRWVAATALGRLRDPRAVEPLVEALKDENRRVRAEAAEVLGELKDLRAVEPLIEALKDKEGYVRAKAAEVLGKIKDPRAVEPLIEALKDKDSDVRQSAAIALGDLKDLRAVDPLIEALKDEDWRVRQGAASALGKLKDLRAVERLIEALKDKDPVVRWVAATALGELKDPRAVEPLIEALKDKHGHVKERAEEALQKITGKDFGKDPEKWQKWWKENKERFIKGK
jgi:HEAT repeat protein